MQSRAPLLCCLALAVGLPLAGSRDRSSDELTDRVTELEAQIVVQRAEIDRALGEIATLQEFQAAVIEGSKVLADAVADSRKSGFEWAGPNPQSKKDLLDGLNAFGRKVRNEPEPPVTKDTGERSKR